jgi:ligand-binding SRPBCC domain-containing protein
MKAWRSNLSSSSFILHPSSFILSLRVSTFVKESLIGASPERVFAFHEQPRALKLLTPPWETARVIQHARIAEVGSRAIIETRLFGLVRVRWIARHTAYDPPRSFEDVQERGPFRRWRHRHVVLPHAHGAVLRDEIDYEPPLRFLGKLADPFLIRPRLEKMFDYRHEVTRAWCEGQAS